MAIINWVGGASGSFNNKFNWSPQQVPNGTSDVLINPTSAATVTTSNDNTVNSLRMNSHSTLDVAGTYSFTVKDVPDGANPTGTSSSAGTINLASNADLYLSGTFDNSGVLMSPANSDVWVTGKLDNTGSVRQSGDLHLGNSTGAGTAINETGATYSMHGAVDIINGGVAGSSFTNNGNFERTGSGSSDVSLAFINHSNLRVGSGAMHFLGGLTNTGAMTAAGALLQIQRAIAGKGMLDVGSGGNISLSTGADTGQTVDFLAATGKLELGTPSAFAGTIAGFTHGDLIDLLGKSATSFSFANSVLTVKNGATTVASLHFAGNYSSSNFQLGSDGHNGTLISHV